MKKNIEVDSYIEKFPGSVQKKLKQLRSLIRTLAPDAEEVISYHMPAYKYNGMLLYFAGHTSHVGLYSMPSSVVAFKKELEGYKTAKGSIQFPLNEELPLKLIEKIIIFRVQENSTKKKKA